MPLPFALIQALLGGAGGEDRYPMDEKLPSMGRRMSGYPLSVPSPPPDLPLPPDTVGRSQLQYQPNQIDYPSLSMPAQEALSQKFNSYPRFNPGFGTRLVSSLAAGSAGYQQGPMAGLQTGQAYIRAPYQEAQEKFQSEATPLMYKAGVESQNFKNALERAKLQGTFGNKAMENQIGVANANSRMEQEESRRYNARTAAQQANIRKFIAEQPDQVFRETEGGKVPHEIVGFDKKSGEVNRTGISGQGKWRDLEDLKSLIRLRYKELGRLLRDVPQKDVFAAIDNAARQEGLRNPALYGKFFGENGFLKSPEELKKYTGDDAQLIRDLMDVATKKASESLTKSKDLKQGVVNPNQTIKLPNGATILNPYDDDEVPSENDEEQ